jgi:HSP20 family protein
MAQTASKVPATSDKKPASPPATLPEWRPFESLRREIDQLFDGFHASLWRAPSGRTPFDARPLFSRDFLSAAAPVADISETDKGYEVTAELPGIDAGDIDIKFANDTLTISGEKKAEKEEKRKDYHLSERHYGSFQRVFRLPPGVDDSKIDATFQKGVLKVTLPKNATARNHEKKIPISSK